VATVGSSYSSLPDSPPDHPLAIAHRHGNLVDLVSLATAAGVDLLEMDVFAYRGRLEVRHSRRLGPWLLDGWRLHRWTGKALELETVLAALPPQTAVMIDVKGWRPATGRMIAEAMATRLPGQPYAVCGRTWRMLAAFESLPEARVVPSAGSRRELARLLRRLDTAPAWGVSVRRQLLTPDLVARLRERTHVVMGWHVENAERLAEVLALGVNGVICDDLSVLATLLAARADVGGGAGL
jgi:glycerophosphoryl diester phosphodiesterase